MSDKNVERERFELDFSVTGLFECLSQFYEDKADTWARSESNPDAYEDNELQAAWVGWQCAMKAAKHDVAEWVRCSEELPPFDTPVFAGWFRDGVFQSAEYVRTDELDGWLSLALQTTAAKGATMNNLEFRAWWSVHSQMFDVIQMNFDDKHVAIHNEMNYQVVPFNECIVMQSTGLKDKNGKVIFEGDVLEHPVSKDRFSVKWCGHNCGFRAYYSEEYATTIPMQIGKGEAVVIGNIHENPELLEAV